MAKRKHYKSIEFDLDTKKLQEYYNDYRTAYHLVAGHHILTDFASEI